MITRGDLDERVREWGLRDDTVEKDFVLGWTLWGIGSDAKLSNAWVFKGGTCFKKCYIETLRFSEDLDFTVMPGGPIIRKGIRQFRAQMITRAPLVKSLFIGYNRTYVRYDDGGGPWQTRSRKRLSKGEMQRPGSLFLAQAPEHHCG